MSLLHIFYLFIKINHKLYNSAIKVQNNTLFYVLAPKIRYNRAEG